MQLELSGPEARELAEALRIRLGELRVEIDRADARACHAELEERHATLAGFVSRLVAAMGRLVDDAEPAGAGRVRRPPPRGRRQEGGCTMRFRDRSDAGQRLAGQLLRYRDQAPLVLGLPRGGVPVAHEVARALAAPLDIWVVRKLGAPIQPELGMGAIAEGGEVYIDPRIVDAVGASDAEVSAIADEQAAEIERRVRRFRGDRPRPDVRGRTVLVIDDGIATGGTVRAALRAIRKEGAARVVLGVPVAAAESLDSLAAEADEIVCLYVPPWLGAIGQFYLDFRQTTDEEVLELLREARRAKEPTRPREPGSEEGALATEVAVTAGEVELEGTLTLPAGATGIVLFAHGSGSSRKSPRNRFVAEKLAAEGVATLLFDLLTPDEEEADAWTGRLRFDVDRLAGRLAAATDWIRSRPDTGGLSIGYFGASTGAAAALIAAALRPDAVRAVVSRGGRPDLAGRHLAEVRAPTLLVVGGEDADVLELNQRALRRLRAPKRLEVVPGATHLFEEPGALEEVARLAAQWFAGYLVPGAMRAAG